jgi:hypothetical protein
MTRSRLAKLTSLGNLAGGIGSLKRGGEEENVTISLKKRSRGRFGSGVV